MTSKVLGKSFTDCTMVTYDENDAKNNYIENDFMYIKFLLFNKNRIINIDT